MKIQVTQDHIDKGKPRRHYYCPIALAIRSHFPNLKVSVGNPSYTIGDYRGRFVLSVSIIISKYDQDFGMEPFELEIDYVDPSD